MRRATVWHCGGAFLRWPSSGIPPSAAPQGDAAKKANVAISGCLLRQGYATLIVDEARVDGKGDAAATAQPTAAKPGAPLTAPPRWVLDNAGPHTSHVGERVQLLGVSDWVDESRRLSDTHRRARAGSAGAPYRGDFAESARPDVLVIGLYSGRSHS